MPPTTQDSLKAIQPELTSGENILWAGQPNTRVVFHKQDVFLIPFSLFWGAFSCLWELAVSGLWSTDHLSKGTDWFGILWGIPFVLIGQHLIWGRFLYATWKKKRTHYAVTTRRVIAVQNNWRLQVASAYIDTLPTLIKERGSKGVGTLRFTSPGSMWTGGRGWWGWDGMSVGDIPTFTDIEDVESVYRLISNLREKARNPRPTF